jgi:hypothetical protein
MIMESKIIVEMIKYLFFFLVVIGIAITTACNKGGTGGKATLVVYLKHHGITVKNHVGYPDTVFVKFGADELPGTAANDFDAIFVGAQGEDYVRCEGLKKGKYYLYAAGMDSAGPYRVTGGIPYQIKFRDRKDEINIDIPVKE